MSTKVVGDGISVAVTPVISTSAYSADDQIGGIMYLTGAGRQRYSISTLVSVSLVDKSKNTKPITLFFFNSFPTVSSVDNGMFNVPPAEFQSKCIGHVAFTSGDYAVISGASIATLKLGASALVMKSNAEQGTIYAIAQIKDGGGSYAVGDQLYKFLFNRDA